METFKTGEKVIVADHLANGKEVEAEVDGVWGVIGADGNPIGNYRVWVIMPDRTVRAYPKSEVKRRVYIKEDA